MALLTCLLNGHDVNAWHFVDGGQQCLLRGTCRRCHATQEETTSHDWITCAEDPCEGLICRKCGAVKQKEKSSHEWGDWHYVDNHSCVQENRCKQCGRGNGERRTPGHVWGPIQYTTSTDCDAQSVCTHCGAKSVISANHVYADIAYLTAAGCEAQRTCVRCGQKEPTIGLSHKWGHWEQYALDREFLVRTCTRCGEGQTQGPDVQTLGWKLQELKREYDRCTSCAASLRDQAQECDVAGAYAAARRWRDDAQAFLQDASSYEYQMRQIEARLPSVRAAREVLAQRERRAGPPLPELVLAPLPAPQPTSLARSQQQTTVGDTASLPRVGQGPARAPDQNLVAAAIEAALAPRRLREQAAARRKRTCVLGAALVILLFVLVGTVARIASRYDQGMTALRNHRWEDARRDLSGVAWWPPFRGSKLALLSSYVEPAKEAMAAGNWDVALQLVDGAIDLSESDWNDSGEFSLTQLAALRNQASAMAAVSSGDWATAAHAVWNVLSLSSSRVGTTNYVDSRWVQAALKTNPQLGAALAEKHLLPPDGTWQGTLASWQPNQSTRTITLSMKDCGLLDNRCGTLRFGSSNSAMTVINLYQGSLHSDGSRTWQVMAMSEEVRNESRRVLRYLTTLTQNADGSWKIDMKQQDVDTKNADYFYGPLRKMN